MLSKYYEILEIPENSDDVKVRKAFTRLAKNHHPDLGGDKEKFNVIREAYENILKSRASDTDDTEFTFTINGWSMFGDEFDDIINAFNQGFIYRNSEINVSVTVDDVLKGEVVVDIDSKEQAIVPLSDVNFNSIYPSKKINDIVLVFDLIPGKNFDVVDGLDLYKTVKITPWEVALGTEIELKHGREILIVKLKKYKFNPYGKIRVKGKGLRNMPYVGDLFLSFVITYPDRKMKIKERKVWERLAETIDFDPRNE